MIDYAFLLFSEIFKIKLINPPAFFEMLVRFSLNIVVLFILVRLLYYPASKRKDYLFTYFLLGSVVFLLCILLGNVKLQIGFALGLFAIFGIIRYRTNQIPIKEMTYLFAVIGISVVNALTNKKVSWAELVFTNAAILFITFGLERIWLLRHESRKVIVYEKIDLIKPENRQLLLDDLSERTGININRVEIGRLNFLNDTARITIYYFEDDNHINLADDMENYRGNDDDDD